jgi:hypothetical protein
MVLAIRTDWNIKLEDWYFLRENSGWRAFSGVFRLPESGDSRRRFRARSSGGIRCPGAGQKSLSTRKKFHKKR